MSKYYEISGVRLTHFGTIFADLVGAVVKNAPRVPEDSYLDKQRQDMLQFLRSPYAGGKHETIVYSVLVRDGDNMSYPELEISLGLNPSKGIALKMTLRQSSSEMDCSEVYKRARILVRYADMMEVLQDRFDTAAGHDQYMNNAERKKKCLKLR